MRRVIWRWALWVGLVGLFGAQARAGDEPVRTTVLVPGFRVESVPVKLTNANGLTFGPDGKLYVLLYDGRVMRLVDRDGDGMEESSEVYWDKEPFVSPIAQMWGPKGLYVSSHRKISLLVDNDGDAVADRAEVVATGWPEVLTGGGSIDVMGFTFDRAGALYANIGCADFTNAYLVKDGKAHYSRGDETGVILKFAPDLKSRAIFATGLRFNFALRFNKAGDLFGTEQEGATWLEGANVLDEVNHLQAGRHYGWPPRHATYLPDVIDEPAAVVFDPQHGSACGMVFNEPTERQGLFGPKRWEGDAFVTLFSRGRINRVQMVKTAAGYVGQSTPFLMLNRMPSDVAISPAGALYVSAHSGPPDWGAGPKGEGTLLRVSYVDPAAPQPVAAWAEGPLDARVAFDRPIDAGAVENIVGSKVRFGAFVRAGDRFEVFKPPYKVVEQQVASPRGTISVAAARLEDEGRTLAVTTDPQPWDARYEFVVPVRGDVEVDVEFRPRGVETAWQAEGGDAKATLWWPHLDLAVARRLTEGSAAHARAWEQLGRPGTLALKSQIQAQGQELTLTIDAGGTLAIEEAVLDGEPGTLSADKRRVTLKAPLGGLPLMLELLMRTGVEGGASSQLQATYHTDVDPTERPLQLAQLVLPWAPTVLPAAPSSESRPPALEGADAARGMQVFLSEEAKCATCHIFRGQGKAVGPDLGNLHTRDVASIFRDIADPSVVINPDYVPYTVSLKDGRVLAGIVRAEGNDRLRVTDTNAVVTEVARSEVEELRPSATSIMPVGLSGALGEQKLKDLVKYLSTPEAK